jgi:hypothetical protein
MLGQELSAEPSDSPFHHGKRKFGIVTGLA